MSLRKIIRTSVNKRLRLILSKSRQRHLIFALPVQKEFIEAHFPGSGWKSLLYHIDSHANLILLPRVRENHGEIKAGTLLLKVIWSGNKAALYPITNCKMLILITRFAHKMLIRKLTVETKCKRNSVICPETQFQRLTFPWKAALTFLTGKLVSYSQEIIKFKVFRKRKWNQIQEHI